MNNSGSGDYGNVDNGTNYLYRKPNNNLENMNNIEILAYQTGKERDELGYKGKTFNSQLGENRYPRNTEKGFAYSVQYLSHLDEAKGEMNDFRKLFSEKVPFIKVPFQ